MSIFVKGDIVILLDRPLGHPTKIKGVVVGHVGSENYNILLTNGFGKGNIKRVSSLEIKKEEEYDEKQED
tara:strand:+ start:24736 stop:24945 length:210 start_codon:yes stop_codon:yes gene_type:complete